MWCPAAPRARLGIEAVADSADAERSDVRQIRNGCSLGDAIGEIQAAARHMVIASEYLSLSRPEHLAEILADAKISVSGVVCYLRRQDHICASGYAQSVKTLGHSERIGTALYTDLLNWHRLYETWQAVHFRARSCIVCIITTNAARTEACCGRSRQRWV